MARGGRVTEEEISEMIALRDRGMSQRRAGRILGMTQAGINSRCMRLGIRWNKSDVVKVRWNGRLVTLPELSDELGINYHTLYTRYHIYGWRGERLTAPVRSTAPRPKHYETGYTLEEWRQLVEQLDEIQADGCSRLLARKRLHHRTGLPYGAIAAADRGEWERLS